MFAEFVAKTGAVTEAEREGWSFVFRNRMADDGPGGPCAPGTPWWLKVNGATWHSPEGAPSSVRSRADHPVVHVSWNDVQAYCEWARVRLPTEAEWELAARGGLEQKTYPWGDELTRDGGHMCNIWQGRFPEHDLGEDGFTGTAPADSFQPNGFGLFTMVGNTWEWCEDYFSADGHEARTTVNPVGPASGTSRVIRGGSYLCHRSYCFRYRNSARSSNTPGSTTGNIGFRVVRDL
jgi:formylglycine-generating enzyme required for sulfatase activity